MPSGKTSRPAGSRPGQHGRGAPPRNTGLGSSGSRSSGRRPPPRNHGRGRNPAVQQRQVPWLLLAGIVVIVVVVAVLAYGLISRSHSNDARDSALAPWRPTAENKDPSVKIPGVITQSYQGQHHIAAPIRVRYDHSPPIGGPHDQYWAACTGTVYPNPVRSENMVHAMEHGSVWIAYDPVRITGAALDALRAKVQNTQYMLMSPYPRLDQPISLQSWGHQLKVGDVNDPRIDQFIAALRLNPNTYPEVGASCDALGPGEFDPSNPPPFQSGPYPPLNKGSVAMNYAGPVDGPGR